MSAGAARSDSARPIHPRAMVVCGTRPEAIKLAPLVAALEADPDLEVVTVTTGQHSSVVHQVLAHFGIEADVDLGVTAPRPSLTRTTAGVLEAMAPVIAAVEPDALVVQGDTTSALAAAMGAFYARVPVVHLEAGLRTDRLDSPFPEEGNRRLISQITQLHLAPTSSARDNLLREAVDPRRVLVTGNTVIDALHAAVACQEAYGDPAIRRLDGGEATVLLVTAHRRESWGQPLANIAKAVAAVADAEPDLQVVFPLHPNPVVREAVEPILRGRGNVILTGPLGYGDMCRLLGRARLVLTDSGGIQEEAPAMGTPVLVTRDTTERPEGLAAGTARLVGTDPDRIVAEVARLLHDPDAHERMARAVNPYGDGRAAPRAVAALRRLLSVDAADVEEFSPEPCLVG